MQATQTSVILQAAVAGVNFAGGCRAVAHRAPQASQGNSRQVNWCRTEGPRPVGSRGRPRGMDEGGGRGSEGLRGWGGSVVTLVGTVSNIMCSARP